MNVKRAFLAAVAVLMVPSLAMAQTTVTFSTEVLPAAAGTPEMMILCDGGLPLDQTGAAGTTFSVTELAIGDVCTVSMTGDLTAGYELGLYYCGTGVSLPDDSGCQFTMNDSTNTWHTEVTAVATPADFNVTVDWTVSEDADPGVGAGTEVTVQCEHTTKTVAAGPNDTIVNPVVTGVEVGYGCKATLFGYGSAVEVTPITSDCTKYATLNGGDLTCAFTATAFYEGIPTLSQYGMAIMALLMLGVGFVGFRRFV